mmetsp:Transcript_24252/g.57428  ORF Transcript_24252/g.57428 Transcript_24252/m.57428 type:complete len:437 (+) Transcript_24252:108-1418(+)
MKHATTITTTVVCCFAATTHGFSSPLINGNHRARHALAASVVVPTTATATESNTALWSFFPGADFDASGGRGRSPRRGGGRGGGEYASQRAAAATSDRYDERTYEDRRSSPVEIMTPRTRAMPLVRRPQPQQQQQQQTRGPMVQQQQRRRSYVGQSQQQQRQQQNGRGLSLQDLGSLQDMRSKSFFASTLGEEAVEVDTVTGLSTIQGGSLKTWSFPNPKISSVQVFLKTEGRPLNSVVELWNGPDNTPVKCAVYLEDGDQRAFSAVFATPRSSSTNALSVKNTSPMEFPVEAAVEANHKPLHWFVEDCMNRDSATHKKLQGGAVCTVPMPPSVQSAAVLMRTEGRPLNARLELMQGPSNNKQVLEIYSENGLQRPFFTIVETPGQVGTVIRVVNAGTVEFPVTINIQPYAVDPGMHWDEDSWTRQYTPDDFFFAM